MLPWIIVIALVLLGARMCWDDFSDADLRSSSKIGAFVMSLFWWLIVSLEIVLEIISAGIIFWQSLRMPRIAKQEKADAGVDGFSKG